MNAPTTTSWTEANQRLMVAEFGRLKQRLGAEEDDETIASALESARAAIQRLIGDGETTASPWESARAAMTAPAAIDHLSHCFGLSAFERDVLLLCAGVEMDAKLAAQCEIATGEPRRSGATFGLALAALEVPHWSALAPVSPLRRWRLVEVDESAGLARGRLRIDERILHYLAGANYLDVRLRSLLREATPPTAMADAHRAVCEEIIGVLGTHELQNRPFALSLSKGLPLSRKASTSSARPEVVVANPETFNWGGLELAADDAPLIALTGDDTLGQADVAAQVAAALGVALQVLRADDVPSGHAEIEALVRLWEREAMLLGSALLVNCGTDPLPAAAIRFIEALRSLVFVSASQPLALERPSLRFTVDKPGPVEQKILW